jgi:hypothetical protein
MKKALTALLAVLVAVLMMPAIAFAADIPLVNGDVGLFSLGEYCDLMGRAESPAEKCQCSMAIITLEEIEGDPCELAQELYGTCHLGYGTERSGLLSLLSMERRDPTLLSCGFGGVAFTDYGKIPLSIILAAAFLLPLTVAGITCSIWKRQMKAAAFERTADSYIPRGGFVLTRQEDSFLYSEESRGRIGNNSSGDGGKNSPGFSGRTDKS